MFHYLLNPQYPRFKNIIPFFYNYSDRLLGEDERCEMLLSGMYLIFKVFSTCIKFPKANKELREYFK